MAGILDRIQSAYGDREKAIEAEIHGRYGEGSISRRVADAEVGSALEDRAAQREYATQADPEALASTKEMLENLGKRGTVLEVLRKLTPEQREEVLKVAPGLAQQMGDEGNRGGVPYRAIGALSRGVSHGFTQPISELVGTGGTDEEIEFIRQLDSAAAREFHPGRPGDPWYERGPLQALEMLPWMATIVSGAGAGRQAATGLAGKIGLAATGTARLAKAGEVAGTAAAAFPSQYAQEVDSLKQIGMEDDWKLRLLAVATATVQGAIEAIVPNPFPGRTVPLTEGAVKAARQYLWEAVKRAPGELSEEYFQGVTGGLGEHVAQYIDENAEDKSVGDAFRKGWEQGKEAALPMAFLLGVPAVGGAAVSAHVAAQEERRTVARAQETGQTPQQIRDGLAEINLARRELNLTRELGSAGIEGLAQLDKPPSVHDWAEIVLGDRSKRGEAPNRAVRREQWRAARELQQKREQESQDAVQESEAEALPVGDETGVSGAVDTEVRRDDIVEEETEVSVEPDSTVEEGSVLPFGRPAAEQLEFRESAESQGLEVVQNQDDGSWVASKPAAAPEAQVESPAAKPKPTEKKEKPSERPKRTVPAKPPQPIEEGVPSPLGIEVKKTNQFGRAVKPVALQARQDFASRAKPGATFKHISYKGSEFRIEPDGSLFEMNTNRVMGKAGFLGDLANDDNATTGIHKPRDITWTSEGPAEPQAEAEAGTEASDTEVPVDSQPTHSQGIVVASRGLSGAIYYGQPGETHGDIYARHKDDLPVYDQPTTDEGVMVRDGFATPDGQFLTRDEAEEFSGITSPAGRSLDATDVPAEPTGEVTPAPQAGTEARDAEVPRVETPVTPKPVVPVPKVPVEPTAVVKTDYSARNKKYLLAEARKRELKGYGAKNKSALVAMLEEDDRKQKKKQQGRKPPAKPTPAGHTPASAKPKEAAPASNEKLSQNILYAMIGEKKAPAKLTPGYIDFLSATADTMVQGIRVKRWSFAQIVAFLAETFGRADIPDMREYLERGWNAAVKIEGVEPANYDKVFKDLERTPAPAPRPEAGRGQGAGGREYGSKVSKPDLSRSKVKDKVFHGTRARFDRFYVGGKNALFGTGISFTSDTGEAERYSSIDPGVNFDLPGQIESLSQELSITYAEAKKLLLESAEPGVVESYIDLRNPMVVDADGKIQVAENVFDLAASEADVTLPDNAYQKFSSKDNTAEQVEYLIRHSATQMVGRIASIQNHDGMILRPNIAPKGKGGEHYVVFNPDQVHIVSRRDTAEAFSDGARFFTPKAIERAEKQTGYKSRETIVNFTPDEFLMLAEQLGEPVPSKRKTVSGVLAHEGQFNSLPQLLFEIQKDGTAKVVGHEGRHRAMALKELGMKSIPVVFVSQGSNPIRWSEQADPKAFDRITGPWPTVLKGETSGEVAFPVPDPAKGKPRVSQPSPVEDLSGTTFYHGRRGKGTEFSPEKLGTQTDPGFLGEGFYFDNSRLAAKNYGTNIIEAKLNLQNPLVIPKKHHVRMLLTNDEVLPDKRLMPMVKELLGEKRVSEILAEDYGIQPTADMSKAFTKAARELGYDGVLVRTESEDYGIRMEAVVFDASQILPAAPAQAAKTKGDEAAPADEAPALEFTPEAATEAWVESQPDPSFIRRRNTLIAYTRRLAKRLDGWKTADQLTVKDRKGKRDGRRTADTLKEMSETGHVQLAWDRTGMPHYAWGNESIPEWLTQSQDEAVMEKLPPQQPASKPRVIPVKKEEYVSREQRVQEVQDTFGNTIEQSKVSVLMHDMTVIGREAFQVMPPGTPRPKGSYAQRSRFRSYLEIGHDNINETDNWLYVDNEMRMKPATAGIHEVSFRDELLLGSQKKPLFTGRIDNKAKLISLVHASGTGSPISRQAARERLVDRFAKEYPDYEIHDFSNMNAPQVLFQSEGTIQTGVTGRPIGRGVMKSEYDGTTSLFVDGKRVGGYHSEQHGGSENSAARRAFPGIDIKQGDPVRRIHGIQLDKKFQGKGYGKQLYLQMFNEHPDTWFYNSQAYVPAVKALDALERDGLIDIKWATIPGGKRKGQLDKGDYRKRGGAAHVVKITDAGRKALAGDTQQDPTRAARRKWWWWPGSKVQDDTDTLFQGQGGPIYHSELHRQFENLVVPLGRAVDVQELKGTLKKGGVKQEELDWYDFDELYKKSGKRKLSSDDIKQWISAHNIEVVDESLVNVPVKEVAYPNTYQIEELLRLATSDAPLVGEEVQVAGKSVRTRDVQRIRDALASRPDIPAHVHMSIKDAEGRVFFPSDMLWRSSDRKRPHSTSGLKGTRNVREVILRVPGAPLETHHHGHTGHTDVLAYARFGDRTDAAGRKILFVENLQSDHIQKYRDRIRKTKDADRVRRSDAAIKDAVENVRQTWSALSDAAEKIGVSADDVVASTRDRRMVDWPAEVREALDKWREGQVARDATYPGAVFNAPFQKSWHGLVMKRVLREAVDGGYDAVAWTSGKTQGARWGVRTFGAPSFFEILYDQEIPKFLKKHTKKMGGRVRDMDVGKGRVTKGIDINPQMRESLSESQALFQQQQQRFGDTIKGWTHFTRAAGAILVGGTEKADFSTFIHEFAHPMRRLLFNRNVPAEKRAGITDEDIAKMEAFAFDPKNWGAESNSPRTGEWDRNSEEAFARAWETYWMEGKAPKSAPELEPIFQKIARWMAEVYGELKSLVNLTPEVRDVFDKVVQRGQVPAEHMPAAETKAEVAAESRFDDAFAEEFDEPTAEEKFGDLFDKAFKPEAVRPNVVTRLRERATELGVDADEYIAAVRDLHKMELEEHGSRTEAKRAAHKKTGLSALDIRRLNNNHFDYSSKPENVGGKTGEKLRSFDIFAQELANDYPGAFDPEDSERSVWGVLNEPAEKKPALDDADILGRVEEQMSPEEAEKQEADEEWFVEGTDKKYAIATEPGAPSPTTFIGVIQNKKDNKWTVATSARLFGGDYPSHNTSGVQNPSFDTEAEAVEHGRKVILDWLGQQDHKDAKKLTTKAKELKGPAPQPRQTAIPGTEDAVARQERTEQAKRSKGQFESTKGQQGALFAKKGLAGQKNLFADKGVPDDLVATPGKSDEAEGFPWESDEDIAFSKWFGDSKVVDAEGNPLVVYHGTIRPVEDDTFLPSHASETALLGRGVYFTSQPEDTDKYATTNLSDPTQVTNPDLIGKIDQLAEDLGISYREAKAEILRDTAPSVYPVYLHIERPLHVGHERMEFERQHFVLAAVEIGQSTDDAERLYKRFDAIKATDEKSVGQRQFELLRQNQATPLLRRIMTMVSGHNDGIILHKDLSPLSGGATHYLVLRSDQIKSATGNRGTYDPDSPNILFQAQGAKEDRLFGGFFGDPPKGKVELRAVRNGVAETLDTFDPKKETWEAFQDRIRGENHEGAWIADDGEPVVESLNHQMSLPAEAYHGTMYTFEKDEYLDQETLDGLFGDGPDTLFQGPEPKKGTAYRTLASGDATEVSYRGKSVGGINTKEGSAIEESSIRMTIPDLPEGTPVRRIQGIEVSSKMRGRGLGQHLYLRHMDRHPDSWFWNSQVTQQAAASLEKLADDGLIDLRWHSTAKQMAYLSGGDFGAHAMQITPAGRQYLAAVRSGKFKKFGKLRAIAKQLDELGRREEAALNDAREMAEDPEKWREDRQREIEDRVNRLTFDDPTAFAHGGEGWRLLREVGRSEQQIFDLHKDLQRMTEDGPRHAKLIREWTALREEALSAGMRLRDVTALERGGRRIRDQDILDLPDMGDRLFQSQEDPTQNETPEAQAVRIGKSAVEGGATTFEKYIEHAREQLGNEGVRSNATNLEEFWDYLKKKGYKLGPTGKVANILKDAPRYSGTRFAGVRPKGEPYPDHQVKRGEYTTHELTGMAKAVMNDLRDIGSIPELEGTPKETVEEWVRDAATTIAADKNAPTRLLNDIINNPTRALDHHDVMLLAFRYRELANQTEFAAQEMISAAKSGDPALKADAHTKFINARQPMTAFEELTLAAKSTWGRTGVALQVMLRKDFSPEGLLRRARSANHGEELSPNQELEIRKLAAELAEIQKRLDAEIGRADKAESELAALKQHKTTVREGMPSVRRKPSKEQKTKLGQAWSKIAEIANVDLLFQAASNPFDETVQIYRDIGVTTFAEIRRHVQERLGEEQAAKLDDQFRQSWENTKPDTEVDVQVGIGDVAGLTKLARTIQRDIVEGLLLDHSAKSVLEMRDQVHADVHEEMQRLVGDNFTIRQTRDALSAYGQFSRPSKETNERLLRDLNAEALKIAQIDQLGEAIKRAEQLRSEGKTDEEIGDQLIKEKLLVKPTGLLRDPDPKQSLRDLVREYNEKKKEIPASTEGRDGLLQTAVAAIERGLANRILDLNRAIKEQTPISLGRKEPRTTPAIEEMKAERDQLLKDYREKFPPTAEERLANAIKSVGRSIAAIEKQLETRNFDRPKTDAFILDSPEILALKRRLDQLKAQRDAAKALELSAWEGEGGAVMTPPERTSLTDAQRQTKRAENEIKRLQQELQDIKEGREKTKTKQPDLLSPQAKQDLEMWRERLRAARLAARIAELNRFDDEGGAPAAEPKAREKKKLTPEQRLANKIASTIRSIESLEKQLETRNFDKPQKEALPESQELDDLRRRLKRLISRSKAVKASVLAEWEGEGGALGPDPKETAYLKAYMASLQKRIEKYQQILDSGDFSPRKKPLQRKLSKGESDRKTELANKRHEVLQKMADYNLAHLKGVPWALDIISETLHLARAIETSFDLSALGRQGGLVAFGHPDIAARALKDTLASIAVTFDKNNALAFKDGVTLKNLKSVMTTFDSQKAELAFMHQLMEGEWAEFRVQAGLSLPSTDQAITRQEEVFQGRWGKFVPGVAVSSRLYTMILNKMRSDMFDLMVDKLGREGKPTLDEAKMIANFVNVMTGRADFGRFNKSAAAFNNLFFSPRYVVSRLQYIAMPFYLPFKGGIKANWQIKRAIYKEYARTFAGAAVVLSSIAIAAELFWDDDDEDKPTIGTDWTTSDFLKPKIGETRYDILAGMQQIIVFSARMLPQWMGGGRIGDKEFGGTGPYDQNRLKVARRFARTKLAPGPGFVITGLNDWVDVVGNKADRIRLPGFAIDVHPAIGTTIQLFVPLSLRDVLELGETRGAPMAVTSSMLAILGIGASTYGPKTQWMTGTKEGRAEQFEKDLERMQWDTPDPTYSEFLTDDQMKQVNAEREERKQSVVTAAVVDATTDETKETLEKAKDTLLNETGWDHEEAQQHLWNHYHGIPDWDKFNALGDLYEPRQWNKAGELVKDPARDEIMGPNLDFDTDFGKWRDKQAARWKKERDQISEERLKEKQRKAAEELKKRKSQTVDG